MSATITERDLFTYEPIGVGEWIVTNHANDHMYRCGIGWCKCPQFEHRSKCKHAEEFKARNIAGLPEGEGQP